MMPGIIKRLFERSHKAHLALEDGPTSAAVEMLAADVRDSAIDVYLARFLGPLGFVRRGPRSWIDGRNPPYRRLFEVDLLGGGSVYAAWGVSLDFVPHIADGHVAWHASDADAHLDVTVDPSEMYEPSYLFGPVQFDAELQALLPDAITRATESWRRCRDADGCLQVMNEIRRNNSNRLRFLMYEQMPLTLAMLTAKAGDLGEATEILSDFVNLYELGDEPSQMLVQIAQGLLRNSIDTPISP
jgi:hypothetical protein